MGEYTTYKVVWKNLIDDGMVVMGTCLMSDGGVEARWLRYLVVRSVLEMR